MTDIAARPEYFDRYATINFERDDAGVLTVRLHSNDGPVVYSHQHYEDWSHAFRDIGMDRDNRVVIITGTGDAFCDKFGQDDHIPMQGSADWDHVFFHFRHALRDLLDIEVPVIGAVNGPATIHAELALLSDITLASNTAYFQDEAHIGYNTVPGDGSHIFWLEWLGLNRGPLLFNDQSKNTCE